ncbi:universal stress protein [Sediminicola luteus]|uniref:UspA domain-containing protein n=1 Tax=Sediminicola luteus TaxID=319238 RepID=A0A2A4G8R3_9FLAO|nr:universal stress protein [Sediminicola luteus]PCE64364.1 hypothetical protein B7P33_08700 [Sediminicola luteus]
MANPALMPTSPLRANFHYVVLMDLSKASYTALKQAVNMAKRTSALIEILYVERPLKVVGNENQLSALRELESESQNSKRKLQNLIELVREEEQIQTIFTYRVGHPLTQIKAYLSETRPHLVFYGKKKSNIGRWWPGISQYLLQAYQGAVFISRENGSKHLDRSSSIGSIGSTTRSWSSEVVKTLSKNHRGNHVVFKLSALKKNPVNENHNRFTEDPKALNEATTFEFEGKHHLTQGISRYAAKCNIGLFCWKRPLGELRQDDKNIRIEKLIEKLDMPLLITGQS